jgi:hypothetical protein
MKRFLSAVTVVAVSVLAAASPASASGPAAPGKEILTIDCQGIGTLTVSVQRGENSNGVGQIVGAKGHGIPVRFSFTVLDVTTGDVVFSDTESVGGGHAHPNQPTTACSFTEFEGTAAEVFDGELPPGVEPTDVVRGVGTVDVIIKR